MNNIPHISILKDEVLKILSPKDGEIFVDGTFGAGGHSRAILESANCRIVAIDRDPNVTKYIDALQKTFGERITFVEGRFGEMDKLLSSIGINKVDGILLDLGVSSMQLDEAERGFSFRSDAALDMRMESKGRSAADLVNNLEEKELADIIYYNGGEKKSRYIARAIVEERAIKPITRTIELAELVKKAVRSYNDTIHPATRTFQALRMEVNNELGELRSALAVMPQLLEKNGRLAVITFHSGEDELVKEYIRNRSGQVPNVSRYLPETETTLDITFKPLGRKAFLPSEDEIKNNPRARSAKLRGAMKLH